MTYSVFYMGRFMHRFATRDSALAFVISQAKDAIGDYEITDESDEL
jgi:hypothetical protein